MKLRFPSAGIMVVSLVVFAAFLPLVLHTISFFSQRAAAAGDPPALRFAVPDTVPPGVEISISDAVTQRVFEQAGWEKELPFKIKWVAIVGGPAISEAMNAKALDGAVASDIPPIQSHWSGVPVRILGIHGRKYPDRFPAYKFAFAPGVKANSLADLKGKRIVTSKGQMAGMLVMRTLAKEGIRQDEVTLIDIAMGDDYYLSALGSGAADAAPLATSIQTKRYMDRYGPAGAKLFDQNVFRDDMRVLYARQDVLQDPAKAAALKIYTRYMGRAVAWINLHSDRWIEAYYVKALGLKRTDGLEIVRSAGPLDVPGNWADFRRSEQESIDFLSAETSQPRFAVEALLDPRFEPVAAEGFGQEQAGAR